MARLFKLPRPEAGEEHGVVWLVHHSCRNAAAIRAAVDDPDVDLLQFSVGVHGYGMPLEVPFQVTSTNECSVCGKYIRAWFQWTGPRVITPALWTPTGA